MKYLKRFENTRVKEGDYVVFLDNFNEDYVKKNYPYEVDFIHHSDYDVDRAFITCDDGEQRSFRAENSQVYRKITKEQAKVLLSMYNFNL